MPIPSSQFLLIHDNKNIIFLIVDDLGSGDVDYCPDDVDRKYCPFSLTRNARRTILHTPRLRRMAEEGQILTNFYSPRAICTPSRAGLMMGRDPARYGMYMYVWYSLYDGSRTLILYLLLTHIASFTQILGMTDELLFRILQSSSAR